jgi:hypothetical protein
MFWYFQCSFFVGLAMFCENRAPSRDFCACRIASIAARCEFWYRLRNTLSTLCVSDRSCCGAVRILQMLWDPLQGGLRSSLEDPITTIVQRVHGRLSCMKILTKVLYGLVWSCRGLCEKMLWRSKWNPLRGLVEILVKSSLVQVRRRSSCEDPAEILHEILAFCTDPYEKIFWGSFWNPLKAWAHPFAKICKDPVEIVVKSSLRGPCVILCRCLCEDLVEILLKFSLRGHCIKIVKMLCIRGVCMKVLLGCS